MPARAFYEREGELIVPTELTRGPWDPDAQHAGPPVALIGRAIENLPAAAPMRVGRVTYEVLRPIPIAPLRVEAGVLRDGRRVQHSRARLVDAGSDETVMRATAWRLRVGEVALNELPRPQPPPRVPGEETSEAYFAEDAQIGYHTAVEYRFVRGSFAEPGPALVWMRSRVALIAGEELTPLQRVLVVADSGNGVSAALDWSRFLFINVDLSVHLHRYPGGEWVCLDAVTRPERDGIGLADTLLADESGPIGRSAQTLLVDERG